MPEVGWVDRSIGDCLNTSFAGEWGSEPAPGNAIVLRATDIDNDGHVVGAGAIRSIPNSKLCAKRLHQGDILLEGSGGGPDKPVGRVALFDASAHSSPAVCSNFFKTLRPAPHVVHDRFLWRKLGWFYRQPALLALQQQTTGIINLKFAEYLCVRISLPVDVAEQVKIAEVLDTLDTTIRQTEAIIDKLKQVKQGLLHDLLTRGIADNGELRPPQSEAPHLYKESVLGWIPDDWCFGPIEQFLDRIIDYRGKTPEKTERGIPLITARNVRLGYVDPEPREFISEESFNRWMTRGIPKKGDVLFTTEAPLGNVGQIVTTERLAFAQRMIILQAGVGLVDSFLKHTLLSQAFRRRLFAFGSGSTVEGIQQSTFRKIEICVPTSINEQALIVDRLNAFELRVEAERQHLAKAHAVKAGLMDDLLTGRVRVTPLLAGASP